DHAIARLDPMSPKESRHLVRASRHFGETQLNFGPAFIHDPERRLAIIPGVIVEVIQCPVEGVEARPAETLICQLVIVAMLEQEVARLQKSLEAFGFADGEVHLASTHDDLQPTNFGNDVGCNCSPGRKLRPAQDFDCSRLRLWNIDAQPVTAVTCRNIDPGGEWAGAYVCRCASNQSIASRMNP